jgi:hypothetical protein
MAQVVVYGRRESLDQRRSVLSEAIHAAIMSALEYPPEKKFQPFMITITETPKVNWGIRGQNAADLTLNYRVEV